MHALACVYIVRARVCTRRVRTHAFNCNTSFVCVTDRHWHVLEAIVKELDMLVVTYDAHGHGKSEPLNPEDR